MQFARLPSMARLANNADEIRLRIFFLRLSNTQNTSKYKIAQGFDRFYIVICFLTRLDLLIELDQFTIPNKELQDRFLKDTTLKFKLF